MDTAQVAILVSLGALGLGLINLVRARKLDKRDLFLRMHETLVGPDLVKGRRILYGLDDARAAAALIYRDEDLSLVYRALAMFDVLGLYVENGWISEKTVLDEWGNSLTRSLSHAELFITERYQTIQWHSWPHYRALARKAAARPNPGRGLDPRAGAVQSAPSQVRDPQRPVPSVAIVAARG